MNDELILLCSKKLRAAAGSSTGNMFRNDHGFPYKQILIDVADKLSPGHTVLSWTDYKLDDSLARLNRRHHSDAVRGTHQEVVERTIREK